VDTNTAGQEKTRWNWKHAGPIRVRDENGGNLISGIGVLTALIVAESQILK
jgi:hypothetical protein